MMYKKGQISIQAWMLFLSLLIIAVGIVMTFSSCAGNGDPIRKALEQSAYAVKETKQTWNEIREINLMELQEKTLDECVEKSLTQSECKNLYFDRAKTYYAIGESIDAVHLLLTTIERAYDAIQAGRASNYKDMVHSISECIWHVEFIIRKFQEINEDVPYALQEIRKYLNLLEGKLK